MTISNEPNKPTILTYHYIYTHDYHYSIAITPMEIIPRTNPIGVTINKHTHIVPMDIDPPIVPQRNSVLDGIESRHTSCTPQSPKFTEDFLPVVEKKTKSPFISSGPEKALNQNNLLHFPFC